MAKKTVQSRYNKGPKKRPAWMNYVKDMHEAVIFAKVADELGVPVPRMMRDATIKLINDALDGYKAANPTTEVTNESRDSGTDE
jgi:hypothetical protein